MHYGVLEVLPAHKTLKPMFFLFYELTVLVIHHNEWSVICDPYMITYILQSYIFLINNHNLRI